MTVQEMLEKLLEYTEKGYEIRIDVADIEVLFEEMDIIVLEKKKVVRLE